MTTIALRFILKKENTDKSNYLLWYSQQKKNKSVVATFKRFTLLYFYGITVDDSFFNGQDDIQDEIIYDEDGDNDILRTNTN
ncbi:hypothetical protein TNCV_5063531 [Trichonephila clavipes]|nr:hypothetical protein TNCV_5063531 [Trichonephila clavipes]